MADIELVIKVPEEIYRASQIIDVKYEDVIQIPLEVIANSTPLPKGHGDLIDRNELKRTMEKDKRRALSFVDLTDFVWLAQTILEADMESEG